MAGTRVAAEEVEWETWDDRALAARSKVRWRLLFSGRRTPTQTMSMGLYEIAPGSQLPLHHHDPAEIYHLLGGEGTAEIEGVVHELRAGVSLFIPPGARHRVINTGTEPLRALFIFPTDSFEEISYHFHE